MGDSPASVPLKSFPQGGIHPPDRKLSSGSAIQTAPLPRSVVLLLSQHIGVPARPVVKAGDKVRVGQVVAEAAAFVSAPVHASVSGTVRKIDDAIDVSGYKRPAIFIDVEGDEWLPVIDRSPTLKTDISLPAAQIVDKIKAAGLVGMGGATFPTHVKMAVTPSKRAPEFLLINGVECEPYLTSDHRLMVESASEIIVGILLLLKATGIPRAVIGVESNKMDAVTALRQAIDTHGAGAQVTVQPLGMLYPQGGERQLVKAITGREIPPPPKGLPIDVGCVVVNVATAFAVYEAVQKDKPLIERVVTVTGKSVKSPGNFRARLGITVQELVDLAGGLPSDTGKITAGGPMMGRAFADLDAPLTKGMGGLVIYPEKESKRGLLTNCIRCGRCVTVCPLGLEPYLVAALVDKGDLDKAQEQRLLSCCDCGCCGYICPANRPLVDMIKMGKARVMEQMKTKAGS